MNALRKRSIGGVGAIAVVALGAAACGGGAYGARHASSSSGAPTAAIHSAAVKVGSKTMTILEDSKGRPLYYYGADTGAKSAVGGSLAGLWPAVTSPKAPTASGLDGTVSVRHDTHGSQGAYNGHLLYTFVSDSSGVVTGQGVHNFYVATPGLPAQGG